MWIIYWIFLFVIALLGVGFAYLNAIPVPFNYYFGEYHIPLSLLLITAFGAGLLLGLVAMIWQYIKLKSKLFLLHKKISEKTSTV